MPPAQFKLATARNFRQKVYDDTASSIATSVMSARSRNLFEKHGLGIAWQDRDGKYLEFHTQQGKSDAVRKLLQAGCNPGTLQNPRPKPIFYCVRGASARHNKCLRRLIEYDVNVNVKGASGKTPLMLAVEQEPWDGYMRTIYLLINAGADPNPADRSRDVPLLKLLSENSELEGPQRDALAILLSDDRTDADVSPFGTRNKPLHLAIRRQDPLVVGMLLEKNSSVIEAKNVEGLTPLLLAVSLWSAGFKDDNLKILDLLLEAGANVEATLPGTDKTPLHIAITLGLIHAVRRLLGYKANVGRIGGNGKTAGEMVIERRKTHKCEDCNECVIIGELIKGAVKGKKV